MLCELCLDAAPDGAVRVKKLYDGTELAALSVWPGRQKRWISPCRLEADRR